MAIGTKDMAAFPEVAGRGLGEADLRSLVKAGVVPASVVAGKFVFDPDDVLEALDAFDGGVDGESDGEDEDGEEAVDGEEDESEGESEDDEEHEQDGDGADDAEEDDDE